MYSFKWWKNAIKKNTQSRLARIDGWGRLSHWERLGKVKWGKMKETLRKLLHSSYKVGNQGILLKPGWTRKNLTILSSQCQNGI